MKRALMLSEKDLGGLVADLLAAGTQVVAPARVAGKHDYRTVARGEDVDLKGTLPRRSLKEFFLPATEPIVKFRIKKDGVAIEEAPTKYAPRVVLGAKPCDASALEVLDKVMNWDYRDEFWNGRRAATTVVSLACPGEDASCFCTAVGLSPDHARGSDLMLVPVEGGWRVEVLTDKGEALAGKFEKRFGADAKADAAEAFKKTARAKVEKNLPALPGGVRTWLDAHFEDDYWKTLALACHGCGACASVCPTCHCFDIVDELEGFDHGTRRRNWDTCQTARFTVHGSGHNPRNNQLARYRQRINHKFNIYPQRFGETLCTGCGRCARACPAGMDLPQILSELASRAGGQSPARSA